MSAYLLVGLAVVVVVGFVWMVWEICHAPRGYEDETGFHEGKDPKDQI